MILELPALTSEYIRAKVSATEDGDAVDPTVDVVEFAFIAGKRAPESADWQTGSWETDATTTPNPTYYARAIPSPALVAGTYRVWVRIHDSPELVVRRLSNALVLTP